MALPNPFRRLKASTSSLDDLSAELGRLDRIRLDAQNTVHDLGAKRPALLVDGTDQALAKLDADMATARRAIEQAEARIEIITPEWQEADRIETTARLDRDRRDRYGAAVKARVEGVKILASYEAEARALAAKLRRLVAIEGEIEAANADLPDDYTPVPSAEVFNGRHRVPDVWGTHDIWVDENGDHRGAAHPGQAPPNHGYTRRTVNDYTAKPGSPGYPHRPLAGRVHLPALDPDAPSHWAPGVAIPRRSAEADAFLLQCGVRP
ncbi:MAG: hypothetical protein ACRYGP_16570 [Janthinobacterium lividum]